jgi:hypothetical protein
MARFIKAPENPTAGITTAFRIEPKQEGGEAA